MKDDIFLIFGYIGSANACLMMLPQIYLTIKKQTMEDISMQTISMNLITQILFLPYTIHNKLYPFCSSNGSESGTPNFLKPVTIFLCKIGFAVN